MKTKTHLKSPQKCGLFLLIKYNNFTLLNAAVIL